MPESVTHDQLLRTMDALMERAEAVEERIAEQLRPMLDQQLSVVFYDLTTVRIHGDAQLPDDVRAFGMNKETNGIARQFVLGVVQSAEGLPLMHTVHAGNVGETKTLKGMLSKVLARFPVERVILVADRGLLSLDNIAELSTLAEASERKLEFILAVPARRYAELGGTLEAMDFSTGLAEGSFAEQRLVVAHDPIRAAEQSARRRKRIEELEVFAEELVAKLDAQDEGKSERGRRATDRGAYSRFQRAVSDAELTRFVKADYQADRFSFSVDEEAIARAERFDGKLVLVTNVADLSASEIVTLQEPGGHRTGLPSAQERPRDRPVFHRLPDRIRAHALICFLALVLYPGDAHAPQSERQQREPEDGAGDASPHPEAPRHHRRAYLHRHQQDHPEQLDLFAVMSLPKP